MGQRVTQYDPPVKNGHDARSDLVGTWPARQILLRRDTYLLKDMLKVVVHSGFIFGRLRSLQMRMRGIWEVRRESPTTHPRLLDQGIESTNTTAVTG